MKTKDKIAVMVVDDFEAMRKVQVAQLRSIGVQDVVTVNNGADALAQLRHRRVDVILSDWNMPVMTGLEFLKAVRADPKLHALPFVLVTAEAERERVAEAIDNGVSDLIVKPYRTDRLATCLDRAMNPKARPAVPRPTPSSAPPCTPTEAAAAQTRKAGPPTILAVDDTPDNLRLLSHLFADECVVRVANNGQRALEMCCSDDPPDLVLLDIMMPEMDGFEVARRMREHPSAEAIPVIFITAMAGDEARLRGLELGAVDFVAKPIDPAVLKPRVRNFLRYVGLRKQLQADYDEMLAAARLREDVEHITRHDLKAPLAGVIGLARTLAEDALPDPDELRRRLGMIEEEALRVLNMINLSSELFKIETGRFVFDPQPMDIRDVIERVAAMANVAFGAKRVVATVSVAPSVAAAATAGASPRALGDAALCHSLFQNLIKNACEATPEDGLIGIVIHDQSPLRISIENPGVVPEEIRSRFFEKYVTQGKQGGTGLGTYSARMLAEAQNGGIALEVSDECHTTTITVTLPRAEQP